MGDAARRLDQARGLDLPQALAVVSEAVWWVTMVDATVVRYHSGAYDRLLAGLDPAGRRKAEETLGGLRFVRNWMGYHADPADFVRPRQTQDGGDLPVAEWTWEPVPAPAAGRAPQAREWEMSRYRQYRARLAGQPVGRAIGAAVAFLSGLPAVGDQAGKNSLPALPARLPPARQAWTSVTTSASCGPVRSSSSSQRERRRALGKLPGAAFGRVVLT